MSACSCTAVIYGAQVLFRNFDHAACVFQLFLLDERHDRVIDSGALSPITFATAAWTALNWVPEIFLTAEAGEGLTFVTLFATVFDSMMIVTRLVF